MMTLDNNFEVSLSTAGFEFPASPGQTRMYFLYQFEDSKSNYLISHVLRMAKPMDPDLLEKSAQAVVDENEILRTTLFERDGTVFQFVSDEATIHVPTTRIEAAGSSFSETLDRLTKPEFDFEKEPLFSIHRVICRECDGEEHYLVFAFHHASFDAWSIRTFIEDLFQYYQQLSEGQPREQQSDRLQYIDYTQWLIDHLASLKGQEKKQYWIDRLANLPQPLMLPSETSRPEIRPTQGASIEDAIDFESMGLIEAICKEFRVSRYALLFAVYNCLLCRYSNQDDILVGTPYANRDREEFRNIMGYFANTVVVRSRLDGASTFGEYLQAFHANVLEAFENQEIPFDDILPSLNLPRRTDTTPVFQTIFAYQNFEAGNATLDYENIPTDRSSAKCDTVLTIYEGESMRLELNYARDLFSKKTMERFLTHYKNCLTEVLANPKVLLRDIDFLTSDEKHSHLSLATVSKIDCRFPNLVTWLDSIAKLHRDKVAVACDNEFITYGELQCRSIALALQLDQLGHSKGSFIGLACDRSPSLLVGIIGILRAGMAYVPLDLNAPQERLAYIIEDACLALVVGIASYSEHFPCQFLALEEIDFSKASLSASDLSTIDPSSPAYIIYTSGSTGKPKGCVVSHHNVVRLMQSAEEHFDFSSNDVVSMFHSYAFDFSVWEMWSALLYGGRLEVISRATTLDFERFRDVIIAKQITVLSATPSAFYQIQDLLLAEDIAQTMPLRFVVFGGEALSIERLKSWFAHYGDMRTALVNMYGITETTVHVTYRRLRTADIIRTGGPSVIGEPLSDLSIHLVDQFFKPVPYGVTGEIYVEGAGVSLGYLNRPELNNSKFPLLQNAFGEQVRMYRTNDTAFLTETGELAFAGRNDSQVKIRGYRIELGEIEQTIIDLPYVANAVVLVRTLGNQPKIVAYVVTKRGLDEISVEAMREQLAMVLPGYMIPSFIVPIASVPLNHNGKTDFDVLKAIELLAGTTGKDYAETDTEKTITATWQNCLGLEDIGLDDDFFAIGGDSILSIKLKSLLKKQGLHFEIRDLFTHSTIRSLSRLVLDSANSPALDLSAASETPVERFGLLSVQDRTQLEQVSSLDRLQDAYPASFLQAGMLYHTTSSDEHSAYVDVYGLHFGRCLALTELASAFDLLARQHSILRTRFDLENFSIPVQLVSKECEASAIVQDFMRGDCHNFSDYYQFLASGGAWSLLSQDQVPIKILLVQVAADETLMFICFSHALMDGWSLALFLSNLLDIYQKVQIGDVPSLKPLATTFQDFVQCELDALHSVDLEKYWTDEFQKHPVSSLPRFNTKTGREGIARESFFVSGETYNELMAFSKRYAVSVREMFFAAYVRLLALVTGEENVLTGIVSHGRLPVEDGDQVLGLFLNTLPTSFTGVGSMSIMQLLTETQNKLREHQSHSMYPAGKVASSLGITFDGIFNYTHFHVYKNVTETSIKELKFFEETNFPFLLHAARNIGSDTFEFAIKYDGSKFHQQQIADYLAYFKLILQSLLHQPPEQPFNIPLVQAQAAMVSTSLELASFGAKQPFYLDHFLDQVERKPHADAIVDAGGTCSYVQLAQLAETTRALFEASGVVAGERVGVTLGQGRHLVAAIMALHHLGATYVPLDRELPIERLNYMIQDAQIRFVNGDGAVNVNAQVIPSVQVDKSTEHAAIPRRMTVTPEVESHIIYTSGSTGEPKGVVISHKNLANFIAWSIDYFTQDELSSVLAATSISFDLSIFELLVAPCVGGRVVCKESPLCLLDPNFNERITLINTVPSVMAAVCDQRTLPDSVICVNLAGEALRAKLVQSVLQIPGVKRVNNLYGPSETTTYSTVFSTSDTLESDVCPIGKPIGGTRVLLLDANLRRVPLGAIGEIYILGDGVSLGYNGKPSDQFTMLATTDGAHLPAFRTRDLAYLNESGQLVFVGRSDSQIKVRGYRVELGEIETALYSHPKIQDAIAFVLGENDKKIIAAVESIEINESSLLAYLQERLPKYMVPDFITILPQFPRTVSGKADRQKIKRNFSIPSSKIETETSETPTVESEFSNELVDAVKSACAAILGLDRLPDLSSGFFHLGGDSIKSMLLTNRLRKMGYTVKPSDIMKRPLLHDIVATAASSHYRPRTDTKTSHGLTPIQKRFFKANPINHKAWNQSCLVRINGDFTNKDVCDRIHRTLSQYDELWKSYRCVEGQWQRTPSAKTSADTFEIFENFDWDDEHSRIGAFDRLHQKTDPEIGALMHVGVFNTRDHRRFAFFTCHHLACDLVSWNILQEDLEQAFLGTRIQNRSTPTFDHWVGELNQLADGPNRHFIKDYVSEVSGFRPFREATSKNTFREIQRVDFELELPFALGDSPRELGIVDIIVATLARHLAEECHQQELTIFLENNGRNFDHQSVDTYATFGWLTSIFPVLVSAGDPESLSIQKIFAQRLQNQRIPIEAFADDSVLVPGGVCINYLGELSRSNRPEGVVEKVHCFTGQERHPDAQRLFHLDALFYRNKNKLHGSFGFNSHAIGEMSILKIVEAMRHALPRTIEKYADLNKACSALTVPFFVKPRYLNLVIDSPIAKIYKVYPQSQLQRGIFSYSQAIEGTDAYLETAAWTIKGNLDSQKLEDSLNAVLGTYDVCKTIFSVHQSEFVQTVLANFRHPLVIHSFGQTELFEAWYDSYRGANIDIRTSPAVAFALAEVAGIYHLIFKFHHIALCGWSLTNIIREVLTHYTTGKTPSHQAPQLSEYVSWTAQTSQAHGIEWWKQHLNGFVAPGRLELSLSSEPRSLAPFQDARVSFTKLQSDRIRQFCQNLSITENVLFSAAFASVLSDLLKSDDIIIGSVVATRPENFSDMENMVGPYINTIPLRVKRTSKIISKEWLSSLQTSVYEALERRHYAINELAKLCGIPGNLTDFLIVFENYHRAPIADQAVPSEFQITNFKINEGTNFPLVLVVNPGDVLSMRATVRSEEYGIKEATYILDLIQKSVLWAIDGMQLDPIPELYPLSCVYGSETSLDQGDFYSAFSSNAQKFLQNTAVILDSPVSYETLLEDVERVASRLTDLGIKRIGLHSDRNYAYIVLVLACLRTHTTFVPIALDIPTERFRYILQDAKIDCLYCSNETASDNFGIEIHSFASLNHGPRHPDRSTFNTDFAYILYTSGTTGKPKGVCVSHDGLLNYCQWALQAYGLKQGEISPLFTSISFDLTITSFLPPLLGGMAVEPYLGDGAFADLVSNLNRGKNFGLVKLTPSHARILLKHLGEHHGRILAMVLGGEKLSPQLVGEINEHFPQTRIFNEYGPTETVVGSSWHECSKDKGSTDSVSIGVPISNTSFYLTDSNDSLVPVGVPGEICIGVKYQSSMYHQSATLNREKFHKPVYAAFGEVVYKTGDLGRLLADGTLECLGRLDHQIKINGYRIEVEEVENILMSFDEVRDAAVIIQRDPDREEHSQLAAFLVPAHRASSDSETQRLLVKRLADHLPSYMVPSSLTVLDSIPMTTNGKIDRRQLELLVGHRDTQVHVDPLLVELVRTAFCNILSKEVADTDNFFDVGGDSLLAVLLANKLQELGYSLHPSALYRTPDARRLAQNLGTDQKHFLTRSDLESASTSLLTPTLAWFFDLNLKNPDHWNLSVQVEVSDVEHALLKASIAEIVGRHSVLASVYASQGISARDDWNLDEIWEEVYWATPPSESDYQKLQGSLQLDQGIPFRAYYCREATSRAAYLLLIAHHLCIDIVSWKTILGELEVLLERKQLGHPSSLSFMQWSQHMNNFPYVAVAPACWNPGSVTKEILARQFKKVRPTDGDRLQVRFHSQSSTLLRRIAKDKGYSIDRVLLGLSVQTIARLLSLTGLTVNLEKHGRDGDLGIDLTNTVGWMTQMFPLEVERFPSLRETLQSLSEALKDRKMPIDYYLNLRSHYQSEELLRLNDSLLTFNYVGRALASNTQRIRKARFDIPAQRDPENIRPSFLEMNVFETEDEIIAHLTFDHTNFPQLANFEKEILRDLHTIEVDDPQPSGQRDRGPDIKQLATPFQSFVLDQLTHMQAEDAWIIRYDLQIERQIDTNSFHRLVNYLLQQFPILRQTFNREESNWYTTITETFHLCKYVARRPESFTINDCLSSFTLVENNTIRIAVHHVLVDKATIQMLLQSIDECLKSAQYHKEASIKIYDASTIQLVAPTEINLSASRYLNDQGLTPRNRGRCATPVLTGRFHRVAFRMTDQQLNRVRTVAKKARVSHLTVYSTLVANCLAHRENFDGYVTWQVFDLRTTETSNVPGALLNLMPVYLRAAKSNTDCSWQKPLNENHERMMKGMHLKRLSGHFLSPEWQGLDVAINYQKRSLLPVSLNNQQGTFTVAQSGENFGFPLTFYIIENESSTDFIISYCDNAITEEEVKELTSNLSYLVSEVTQDV